MRCPYCAEEILDAAILCKYCRKRVKRNPYRIFILAVIIISVIIFANTHRREVSRAYYNAKILLGEVYSGIRAFVDAIRMLPEGIRALSEYQKKVAELNDVAPGNEFKNAE